MKTLLAIAFAFLLSSCIQTSSEKSQIIDTSANLEMGIEKQTVAFDSCLNELAKKYSLGKMFVSSDSGHFHNIFVLKKRVYLPERNLTIDYLNLPDACNSHAPVFYLHNDTFQFVLPMFEWYYQRGKDKYGEDTTNLNKHVVFAPEFFKLAQALKLKDQQELAMLMDEFMDIIGIPKVSSGIEFNAYKAKAEFILKIIQAEKGDQKCIEKVRKGISIIQKKYLNTNEVLYSDGALIIILSGLDTKEGELQILNTDCTNWAR